MHIQTHVYIYIYTHIFKGLCLYLYLYLCLCLCLYLFVFILIEYVVQNYQLVRATARALAVGSAAFRQSVGGAGRRSAEGRISSGLSYVGWTHDIATMEPVVSPSKSLASGFYPTCKWVINRLTTYILLWLINTYMHLHLVISSYMFRYCMLERAMLCYGFRMDFVKCLEISIS